MSTSDQITSAYIDGLRKTAAVHGLSLGQLLAAAAMLGTGSSVGAYASDLSQDWGGNRLVNTGVGAGAGAVAGYGLVKGLQSTLAKSRLGGSIVNGLKLGRLALPAALGAAVSGGLSGSRRGKKHTNLSQRIVDIADVKRTKGPSLSQRINNWIKEITR